MNQPKFCEKCGAPLNENEKFCGKCGAPVNTSAQPAPVAEPAAQAEPVQPQAVPADAQVQTGFGAAGSAIKDKKVPIIIAACALVAIIVAIVIIVNLTKYQKIDAKDLFKIEFTGVNGNGKCTAVLNCNPYGFDDEDLDEFYSSLTGEDKEKEEYSDYFSDDKKTLLKVYTKAKDKSEAEDMRDALMQRNKKTGEFELTLELSDDKNLSNGDKIKCTVDYDEDELKEENIKLTNTEFEVEVKGLKDAEEIDMFDGFEIKFSGVDGKGEYSYEYTSTKYPFVSYSAETSNYSLSNGQNVSITAYVDYSSVEDMQNIDPEDSEKGYYFTYEDKTYMVSGNNVSKEFVVEGLTEPVEVDVFEGIKLETSGAVPYLTVNNINTDECPEAIRSYVSFYVDDDYGTVYKVGDKVKIQAYVSSYLEDEGYKPSGTPDSDGYYYKEIEIDDSYGHYFTNETAYEDFAKLDDLFNKEVNEFKDEYVGRASVPGYYIGDEIEKFTAIDHVSTYVALCKGFSTGEISRFDSKTFVYRVYKVSAKIEDASKPKTFYMAIRTDSPYMDSEGNAVYSEYSSILCSEKLNDLVKDEIKDGKVTAYEIKKGADTGSTSSKTDDSSKADDSSSKADDDSSKADDSSSKADDDSSEIVP